MLNENKTPLKDLTDAEKGELLLAAREGRGIQLWFDRAWRNSISEHLADGVIYRVKPEPVVAKVTLFGQDVGDSCGWVFVFAVAPDDGDTHKLTFDVVDGEPCNPVFEKLDTSND